MPSKVNGLHVVIPCQFNVTSSQRYDFARDHRAIDVVFKVYAVSLSELVANHAMINLQTCLTDLPFHNTLLSFLLQVFSQPFYCTKAFFSQADSYA